MINRLVLLVLAMLGLAGCQWALINYKYGAKPTDALACAPSNENPNAFDCFPYFSTTFQLVSSDAGHFDL